MMDPSKLQEGKRAVIMGAFTTKENIGQQVTLVKFVPAGEELHHNDGVHQGIFEGGRTGVWIVHGENLVRKHTDDTTRISKAAAVAPEHLFPIYGDMLGMPKERQLSA